MTKKVVAFLQNAWSREYAGKEWPRELWLEALRKSRSGTRLRTFQSMCQDAEIWWDNTTPHVGDNPDSLLSADFEHIDSVLESQSPDVVVAFGKHAAVALMQRWLKPLLILPHPAHRLVTNDLYRVAGCLIVAGFEGVVEIAQKRKHVAIKTILDTV